MFEKEKLLLQACKQKLTIGSITDDDLGVLVREYEELLNQVRVVTQVGDRLQRKQERMSEEIKKTSNLVQKRNRQLEITIGDLLRAKMGKRASSIMALVALGLFTMEQTMLEPIISMYFTKFNLEFVLMALIFFVVKNFEASLEGIFISDRRRQILKHKKLLSSMGIAIKVNQAARRSLKRQGGKLKLGRRIGAASRKLGIHRQKPKFGSVDARF